MNITVGTHRPPQCPDGITLTVEPPHKNAGFARRDGSLVQVQPFSGLVRKVLTVSDLVRRQRREIDAHEAPFNDIRSSFQGTRSFFALLAAFRP